MFPMESIHKSRAEKAREKTFLTSLRLRERRTWQAQGPGRGKVNSKHVINPFRTRVPLHSLTLGTH